MDYREVNSVKHIGVVSKKHMPGKANPFQDVVCEIVHSMAGLLEEKSGFLPLVGYLDEKCNLPVPNS